LEFGGWWYEDTSLFYKSDRHQGFLDELDSEIAHSREVFIQHYNAHYGDPVRPPAWIAFEVASLGQLSKLYRNLRPSQAKKKIAAYFGLGVPVLESWLECLSYIRNTCAHHCRFWNKTLVKIPKRPDVPAFPIPDNAGLGLSGARAYTAFVIIHYCLRRIGTLGSFAQRIDALLAEYPEIDRVAMGTPEGWISNPFWHAPDAFPQIEISGVC